MLRFASELTFLALVMALLLTVVLTLGGNNW
jgi:hypothetical protein